MPWSLPADMAWFRKNTMDKSILMGRKTFDSIGHPLPGRTNIVITSQDMKIDGCAVAHSLDDALSIAGEAEELMVMGGAQVYKLALSQADQLYITRIHAILNGDTYFPEFDESAWREIFHEQHEADTRNIHPYSFHILERTNLN